MTGEGWHRATGEAAKLAPLVSRLSGENLAVFSSCLIWCLALALQVPWAQAERARPCKGQGGLGQGFLPSGWHSEHPRIDPLCAQPWAGVKERESQDLGPGEPVVLGRLEAWRHENI